MRTTNVDFSVCPFIEREMWFITFNDFCDRRKGIKRLFEQMTVDAQIFYKWYLYSNIHMTEYFKDLIWTFLNFDDEEYEHNLMSAKRIYKVR